MLKLAVDNTNVYALPGPSTFDAGWSCRVGMMRTRGDGREKTRKLWEKHSNLVGSGRLLDALKAYLREKEPTHGFCGLSVFLNGEKYDHWLPDAATVAMADRPPYPQRPALIAALGEPFV